MLRHVDLCSGIGGFALGFEWAGLSRPILFCDVDEWCRKVLRKHWTDVPIENDVKELADDPDRIPDCDILTAGYPCQPFSVAGKQKGAEDDRHIWAYLRKIIAHKRPTWCVFENVYGHVALGLDEVLLDLETEGYATRTFIVPAAGVNAPHKRDRLWIVAYANGESEPDGTVDEQWMVGNAQHNGSSASTVGRSIKEASNDNEEGQVGTSESSGAGKPRDGAQVEGSATTRDVGNSKDNGCDRWSSSTGRERSQDQQDKPRSEVWCESSGSGEVLSEQLCAGVSQSRLGGMVDGLSHWMDEPDDIPRTTNKLQDRTNRLKGLGNAIVPHIAMQIGLTIRGMNEQET